MKRNFIITTGLIDTWEFYENNFVLGKWCEFYETNDYDKEEFRKKVPEKINIIKNKSHWNDKQKLNKICVIETIADQWSIESSNIFKGYFHILGGTISSIKQNQKNDLLIDSLVDRVKKNNIDEVILATSATVEGQTTAFYIQDSLKQTNIKVSKLAQGLPVGGEIESLDDGTLISAFKNRKNFGES